MKLPAIPALPPRLRLAAQLAIAALLVGWLEKSGRLDFKVFASLDRRALCWLAGAMLAQGLMVISQAVRWKLWLQALPLDDPPDSSTRAILSPREALTVTMRGICAGAWTPAGLGLDGIRVAHALRRFAARSPQNTPQSVEPTSDSDSNSTGTTRSIGRVVALASLLDRAVALAALLLLSTPFLLANRSVAAPPLAIGVLVAIIVAARMWRKRGVTSGSARMEAGINWRSAAAAGAWALATHGANILSMGAVIEALSPALPAWRALQAACISGPPIVLSMAIPLTPLGIGVADATGEALLAHQGLSCGGEAVMLGRACWLLLSLACGAAFWLPLHAHSPLDENDGAAST